MSGDPGKASSFKEVFRRSLRPAARLLSRMRIGPDALTVTGWTFAVAAAGLFATGLPKVAGAVMLLGGLFDALDGAVARESGRASIFGAFLDSALDRISEALIFCGIIFYYSSASAPNLALLAALAMTFSLLTSYTRARAEGLGLDCEIGLLERAGRVVILSVFSILGFLGFGLLLISTAAAVTTAQRIFHVRRESRRKRE